MWQKNVEQKYILKAILLGIKFEFLSWWLWYLQSLVYLLNPARANNLY